VMHWPNDFAFLRPLPELSCAPNAFALAAGRAARAGSNGDGDAKSVAREAMAADT